MSESKRSALIAAAAAMGLDVRELKRMLPALNALAEALLSARARDADVWSRALTVSRLTNLDMTREDCRELVGRQLAVAADGKLSRTCRIVLTDTGLSLLQEAIPVGATCPIFNKASRKLRVAGEVIAHVAPQAHNLSTFLASLERAHWMPRVENPLDGLACAGDANRVARAAHDLNVLQRLISFHADGGATTWNWRTGET